ncbi:hypothetical protein [Streptosporangium sp. NPDC020145]|uniref:hypothetical protein n=1 Tax=Streptosporangium sp. NPDC020145 TaxID=3154694 RepID=UPI00341E63C5
MTIDASIRIRIARPFLDLAAPVGQALLDRLLSAEASVFPPTAPTGTPTASPSPTLTATASSSAPAPGAPARSHNGESFPSSGGPRASVTLEDGDGLAEVTGLAGAAA